MHNRSWVKNTITIINESYNKINDDDSRLLYRFQDNIYLMVKKEKEYLKTFIKNDNPLFSEFIEIIEKSDDSPLNIYNDNKLEDLKNLNFYKMEFYDIKRGDNPFKEVVGDKPKYVEFNYDPILYVDALKKAQCELYNMFEKCNSYEDAKKVILESDDVCSSEKGFAVSDYSTGNLYADWVVLYGNDDCETIFWDVRWY